MKPLKYFDEHISNQGLILAVITNTLVVFMVYTPRLIAGKTVSSDGWVGILLGGIVACLLGWLVSKLVSKFPQQSFFSFSSELLTKPIAIIICFLFIMQYILILSVQLREVAEISHYYLLKYTPVEVVCLTFLLVVIYGASGSQTGVFRLNYLFLPIIVVAIIAIFLLALGGIEKNNIYPLFQTDVYGHLEVTAISFSSFVEFGIVLFYISLIKDTKNTPKSIVIGVIWSMILIMFIYIICIGVFGNLTSSNTFFPVLEVTKSIEIPGGFFERLDPIFFVIWTMAVFITCLIALDISIMLFQLIFNQKKLLPF